MLCTGTGKLSEEFSSSLSLFLSSESECAKDCCEASGNRSNVDGQ